MNPMILCTCAVALGLTALPTPEIRASFNADAAAWAATDVVVVSEGDVIDGVVTVIEAWRGPLEPGAELTFSTLAHYRSESDRAVEPMFLQHALSETETVEFVTGERIVLFLERQIDGTLRLTDQRDEDGVGSIAWIEENRAYARIQQVNPGGNGICSTRMSSLEFRGHVERVLALRDGFDRIEAFDDDLIRVMAIEPHCHDRRRFVSARAFEIIAGSKEPGANHLRRMATDYRTPNLGSAKAAISALRASGSKTLLATVHEVLDIELEYWRLVELPEGWWSAQEPSRDIQTYRQLRYGRLMAALQALDGIECLAGTDLHSSVMDMEALWSTRPELATFSNPQVREHCARILAANDG